MAKRQQVLERNKARVISLVLEGLSDAEVAAAMSERRVTVSRQAVTAFRRRHAAEIAPVVAEVERQIKDYAIASKVNRIAGLDALRQRVENWVEERGLVELQETTHESGAVTVRERFAREVSAELRALYRAAAEELDQLPRGNLTIDNRTQVMLVRHYDGYDPETLG